MNLKDVYSQLVNLPYKLRVVCIANLLLAICSGLAIYHGDTTLISSGARSIFVYLQYFLIFISWLFTDWKKTERKYILLSLPICIHIIYTFFNTRWPFSPTLNLLVYLPLLFQILQSKEIRIIQLVLYRYFLIIMSILGIICCISFIFSLGLPYEVVTYYGGSSPTNYVNYNVCYLYASQELNIQTFRLCGLFNEPGYFGTILALVLITNKFKINIGNICLCLAGVFTMSVAFYALIGTYLFLKMFRNIRSIVISILIVFSFVISKPILIEEFPALEAVFERLEYDSQTGKLKGDNRSSLQFDEAFNKSISHANTAFWGNGTNSHFLLKSSTLNYKSYIYNNGVVVFILVLGGLFIGVLKYSKYDFIVLPFLLTFFISFYQRPEIFIPLYFLILIGGVDYIKLYNHEN